MSLESTRVLARLPIVLLAADLVIVALHVATGWPVFDLDSEGNLPTWYSSTKLVAFAVLATAIYGAEAKRSLPWLLVALLFLALSADETASMHERAARWIMREFEFGLDLRETLLSGESSMDALAWPAIFAPLIAGLLGLLALFFGRRLRPVPGALALAFAGIGAYAAAIGLEASVYVLPSMAEWNEGETARYQWMTAVEEAFEFVGTTALFAALVRYRLWLSAVSPEAPSRTSA